MNLVFLKLQNKLFFSRLRDMGDELAKILKEYANNEIVNKSLSAGLDNLSITLVAIEEYRNCEVQRLEAKVIIIIIAFLLLN